MTLRLNGSTSGYTEIDAPAVAGSNTLVLPGGNGSDAQVLSTNGSGALSWVDRGRMVLETAKTATGTAVDFTDIPSWVKRITLMFDGVSTNGTSLPLIRLGDSGGIETTGYTGVSYTVVGASSATIAYSDGFTIAPTSNWLATAIVYGSYTLSLMNAATNTWVIQGTIGRPSGVYVYGAGGTKSLSDTLTQLRITTVNGTDTFDAGSINILYEG